jgi:hypothetical protein
MKTISKQTALLITGLIFLGMMTAACKKPAGEAKEVTVVRNDSIKSILFVGNSLTYTNNLPGIFAQMAKDSGVAVSVQMLAYPNYALEDHWNDKQMQTIISTGMYHYVVVQQGPSSQTEGREMLLDYGRKIKDLCVKYNTQLAFFMVWPARSNLNTIDGVIKNYTDAATETNSLLCPVGLVWKNYFLATGDYSYYGIDGFHPSVAGTESAAKIIFQSLFR